MQPHKSTQIAAHLILPNRTQSPPTTQQVDEKIDITEFHIWFLGNSCQQYNYGRQQKYFPQIFG